MIFLLFNIGGSELFIIILAVVILFGAKRIPEIARGLGKGIREIKNATSDIQEEIRRTSSEITERADVNQPKTKSSKDKSTADSTNSSKIEVETEELQDHPENTAFKTKL